MSQARDWTGTLALNQSPYSLTGSGQVVAVIDSGLDLSHSDFAGNVHSERRCICSFPNCCTSSTDVVELVEHGTAVSGTIVDNPDTHLVGNNLHEFEQFFRCRATAV